MFSLPPIAWRGRLWSEEQTVIQWHEEWLRQAAYDMDTAEFMLKGGRCFYAVFMCHLSLEKALKGLYQMKVGHAPPRTHNLVFLLNKLGIKPPAGIDVLLVTLSEAQIATRYPEDMESLQKTYTEDVVKELLAKAQEALTWIKKQF